MKKYIKVKENPKKVTHLKVEVFYSLGGGNCFSGKIEPRGYYLSVLPIERSDRFGVMTESFVVFSGVKDLILEVKRKSAKAEKEAEKMAEEWEETLVTYVCTHEGLEISEPGDIVV